MSSCSVFGQAPSCTLSLLITELLDWKTYMVVSSLVFSSCSPLLLHVFKVVEFSEIQALRVLAKASLNMGTNLKYPNAYSPCQLLLPKRVRGQEYNVITKRKKKNCKLEIFKLKPLQGLLWALLYVTFINKAPLRQYFLDRIFLNNYFQHMSPWQVNPFMTSKFIISLWINVWCE